MSLSSILGGVVAYIVAVVASALLVFGLYWLDTKLTKLNEQKLLLSGHRSVAIALGATILSQAVLLRHAVFPIMAVMRDLFLSPVSSSNVWRVISHSALFFVILGSLALGSVLFAGFLFDRMTGKELKVIEQIENDNMAVAIFYALVLLGITFILNEGVEDLSRALIPYDRTGLIRLP